MVKQISFIHTADLHLDSPFKGLAHIPENIFKEIHDSTFSALDNLISVAIRKKVDFILITGDLFDNERQSLKAQVRLRKAFEILLEHEINVYISYGNHDFIQGNINPLSYPENVFVFPDEKVRSFIYEKNDEQLALIYGFSYEQRSVNKNKVPEFQISDETVPFHIAMLHGSIAGNTDHDVYAPFQISEMAQSAFDYWALGHIHRREVLRKNPPIVYPGNIQGRNRKETGRKGCYHVVLTDEGTTELSFIPLATIQFVHLEVDINTCEEIHQLEGKIISELEKLNPVSPQLVSVEFKGNEQLLSKWKNEHWLEEIIDIVNEQTTKQSIWMYIFRFIIDIKKPTASVRGEHFIGELAQVARDHSVYPAINELLEHKKARKYISSLSKEELKDIKQEAYDLLLYQLMNK